MEHRWSPRKRYDCSVVVESPPIGSVSALARDIGFDGMFLEISGVTPPLNAPVHIAFKLRGNEDREEFRLPAMVVRRGSDGLGVMFLDATPAFVEIMRRALNEPGPDIATPAPRRLPAPIGLTLIADRNALCA